MRNKEEYKEMKTIGVCSITNTMGFEFKEIGERYVCVDSLGEVYEGEVEYNEEGELIVMVGELEIQLNEIIRVN